MIHDRNQWSTDTYFNYIWLSMILSLVIQQVLKCLKKRYKNVFEDKILLKDMICRTWI